MRRRPRINRTDAIEFEKEKKCQINNESFMITRREIAGEKENFEL